MGKNALQLGGRQLQTFVLTVLPVPGRHRQQMCYSS